MSVILYNFLILILSGRLQLLILVTFHSCFLSIIYAGASYLANDLATETATCTYTEAATQRCSQERGVLKICSKFTGEHSCRSAISIKLESNFTEITLRHGCSPVNLLHIFRTSFPRNTSEQLLLFYPIHFLKYFCFFSYFGSSVAQIHIFRNDIRTLKYIGNIQAFCI